MRIMLRDKWIILFPFYCDLNLHLHKMVQQTSRNITQAENLRFEIHFVLVEFKHTDFFTSYGHCLLNTKL